jgi:hypothetical protein
MESLIEYRFFAKCAPEFYSDELLKVIKRNEGESLTEFLETVDSLVGLLNSRCFPLQNILQETFEKILKIVESSKEIVKFI